MNKQLTDAQKKVLFEGETEAPFSGALLHETRQGHFVCANCGEVLFTSDTKFESGSGWPSFTVPSHQDHVTLTSDTSHGMIRTEISCSQCGAHLGHVFDDGPVEAGGKRYCVNSLCLDFHPKQDDDKPV
jgi:peptide-methionine (R)-S-oxide reductase